MIRGKWSCDCESHGKPIRDEHVTPDGRIQDIWYDYCPQRKTTVIKSVEDTGRKIPVISPETGRVTNMGYWEELRHTADWGGLAMVAASIFATVGMLGWLVLR